MFKTVPEILVLLCKCFPVSLIFEKTTFYSHSDSQGASFKSTSIMETNFNHMNILSGLPAHTSTQRTLPSTI